MKFRVSIKIIIMFCCNVGATLFGQKIEPAILMYHSFDTQNWKHGVSPENLKKQIDYLKNKKTVVTLSDIVLYAKREKELPDNAVAVTVDDGYEDTYTVLFPLAKKYNIPFTLFFTTDLETQEKLGKLPRPTVEQLKEMAESGLVSIQVHGHTHINFPEVLQQNMQDREIGKCREFITQKLDTYPDMLAYPAGFYNTRVVDYVREAGYVAAFTTRMGFVRKGDDILTLNRIVVDRNTSMVLFRLRLSSGLDWYIRLVKRLRKMYA